MIQTYIEPVIKNVYISKNETNVLSFQKLKSW